MRDTLLLSHANPEDNEYTPWLALQLTNEGFRVWCGLTKLLGGEVFWDDIEAVIQTRTAKVLYVLSRTSNGKMVPSESFSSHSHWHARKASKTSLSHCTSMICHTPGARQKGCSPC